MARAYKIITLAFIASKLGLSCEIKNTIAMNNFNFEEHQTGKRKRKRAGAGGEPLRTTLITKNDVIPHLTYPHRANL